VSGPLRQPAPAAAGAAAAAPPRVATAERGESFHLRLVAFAALAGYGIVHWAGLVRDAPAGRTLAVIAIAAAGAWAIGSLPRTRAGALAAVPIALATICVGLAAAGLPLRLLLPGNWAELGDGLDSGLAGIQTVDWPYAGDDVWIRRTILLGAPLLAGLAAAVAFFPARRGAPALRAAGLVLLLLLYGTAVTEHDPGQPLLRGFVLLVLVAAWLWLPRLGGTELGAAAATVLAVGVVSLPLAAALDSDQPWWDYRAWDWFGDGKAITFDWSHRYGPLDWPRDGSTLMNVRSDRPHYWKAETLDAFDGFRWVRSGFADQTDVGLVDLPGRRPEGVWNYHEWNPRWDETIRFTVRSLSTTQVVGAGTTFRVYGIGVTEPQADGTFEVEEPLEKGDRYAIRAYAPNPSADQMRNSPLEYPRRMAQYTTIHLPNEGESALDTVVARDDGDLMFTRDRVIVPLRNTPGSGDDEAQLALGDSSYERIQRLATSLTAGAASSYDAVKAVERHLQTEYRYSERVPSADLPLADFLFRERAGYCQQFSGAMALMLRMAGIPARVAAGFSPGSFNRDTREYRVRDLDAHSWVEVYFTGIGWVPFDPTPSAAPAESQANGLAGTSAARGDAGEIRGGENAIGPSERAGPQPEAGGGGDGGMSGWVGVGAIALLALAGGAGWALVRRYGARRSLPHAELGEAQLAELRAALPKLGWNLADGTTLLGLERRLDRVAGPAAAGYAAKLRAHRFDPRAPAAPTPAERRALRRELTARGGIRARLRGLLAIPPGGPRTGFTRL
jgi:transglutaminase-like putative cysteine protease